jgi:hypothetical protein
MQAAAGATEIAPQPLTSRTRICDKFAAAEPELFKEVEALSLELDGGGSATSICFSPDLSSSQRKAVHEAARKYGLSSASQGIGADRHVIVRARANTGVANKVMTS